MKRNITIIVVLLAAVLAALKYFSSRGQDAAPAGGDQQQEQAAGGVALPEDAQDYGEMPSKSVYSPSQAPGIYKDLGLPEAALAQKGACEGGSPREIMENHGKIWGYFTGRHAAFTKAETQTMYDFIADYHSCLASARRDLSYCNDLPGEVAEGGMNIDLARSPVGYCRQKAGPLLFMGYLSGKAKEQAICTGFISDWDDKDLNRISPADFCEAAARGPEIVSAYVREKMPEMLPVAEKLFPFDRRVCKSDPDCLKNNAMWEGVRTGVSGKCPPSHRAHCAAFTQESQVPCVVILTEMSKRYCSFLDSLNKRTKGYAGLTEDEVKENLREIAEKKAEEDQRRKEEDQRTKEINSRIKKMLGGAGEE